MMSNLKIKYYIHIPIVIAILAIHYVSFDIYNYFYLKKVEKDLASNKNNSGTLYRAGEYKRHSENISCERVPCDSVLVYVTNSDNSRLETHYTKDGAQVDVLFVDGNLERITGTQFSGHMYFIVPLIGIILCLFAVVHDMLRTGTLCTWNIGRSPDSIEKILYLYGLPLLGVGIFSTIVKEVWLK